MDAWTALAPKKMNRVCGCLSDQGLCVFGMHRLRVVRVVLIEFGWLE
jgi:hypothetical protein